MESTIEMLTDTPIKDPRRKATKCVADKKNVVEANGGDGDGGGNGHESTTSIDMTDREHKLTKKLLPSLYDFRTLATMQRCFQRWRPLSSLDRSDGTAMGTMLMENTSSLRNVKERSENGRREKLDWFFSEFQSMKLLVVEHPWFETMMEAVIVGAEGVVKTDSAKKRGELPHCTLSHPSRRLRVHKLNRDCFFVSFPLPPSTPPVQILTALTALTS